MSISQSLQQLSRTQTTTAFQQPKDKLLVKKLKKEAAGDLKITRNELIRSTEKLQMQHRIVLAS